MLLAISIRHKKEDFYKEGFFFMTDFFGALCTKEVYAPKQLAAEQRASDLGKQDQELESRIGIQPFSKTERHSLRRRPSVVHSKIG